MGQAPLCPQCCFPLGAGPCSTLHLSSPSSVKRDHSVLKTQMQYQAGTWPCGWDGQETVVGQNWRVHASCGSIQSCHLLSSFLNIFQAKIKHMGNRLSTPETDIQWHLLQHSGSSYLLPYYSQIFRPWPFYSTEHDLWRCWQPWAIWADLCLTNFFLLHYHFHIFSLLAFPCYLSVYFLLPSLTNLSPTTE